MTDYPLLTYLDFEKSEQNLLRTLLQEMRELAKQTEKLQAQVNELSKLVETIPVE